MPEIVSWRPDIGIIEVRSFGAITGDDWRSSLEEVLRLSQVHGIHRVLVDARELTSMPDTLGILGFGENLPRNIRFGVVAGEESKHNVRFLETVARNRNLELRMFSTVAEALDWLKA